MTITVRLFASCAEAVGASHTNVTIDHPTTVGALRRALTSALPQLDRTLLARSLVAVNAEYADDQCVIDVNDEVALIPPVAGG